MLPDRVLNPGQLLNKAFELLGINLSKENPQLSELPERGDIDYNSKSFFLISPPRHTCTL